MNCNLVKNLPSQTLKLLVPKVFYKLNLLSISNFLKKNIKAKGRQCLHYEQIKSLTLKKVKKGFPLIYDKAKKKRYCKKMPGMLLLGR